MQMYNLVIRCAIRGIKVPFLVVPFIFIVFFSFLSCSDLMAQGNLQVTPTRLIFDGSQKFINVNLVNIGKDSANYTISFIQYRMSDESSVEEITTPDPGQRFADKYIRFYPRNVKLAPDEFQVIKLQLINSEELESGEYRSHLYLRALPEEKILGVEEKKDTTLPLSIKIIPIFGISIPVIIRVGESNTTLSISDLKLEKATDGHNKLNLTIHRTGNMSSIGDINVSYKTPDGKETKIGFAEGMVIYTPNLLRRFTIDLEKNTSIDLNKGTIHVVYTTKNGNNTVKLAEADLLL
jgi:hypothetical protein